MEAQLIAALELLLHNCKHGNGCAAWDKSYSDVARLTAAANAAGITSPRADALRAECIARGARL